MGIYTVSQLAKLAGVTVRALHHYDHIGLLVPSSRTAAGYRLYVEEDLLRLQQILFFRELDFSLGEIVAILDHPEFDQIKALENHRRLLSKRMDRLSRLIDTIDKTVRKLEEDDMSLTDEELYEGFTEEQIERYKREAIEMYDPEVVRESERRVRKMSKAQWQAVKDEGHEVTLQLAALMDEDPGDPAVQALIARHHAWIENLYQAPAELYRALGQGYSQNPEFRAFYDRYRANLADFMASAMAHYAEHSLGAEE